MQYDMDIECKCACARAGRCMCVHAHEQIGGCVTFYLIIKDTSYNTINFLADKAVKLRCVCKYSIHNT